MKGRPQVLVLQVHVHTSLHQYFRREHVVMASTLWIASTEDSFTIYRKNNHKWACMMMAHIEFPVLLLNSFINLKNLLCVNNRRSLMCNHMGKNLHILH